jgi:putative toxin-antitoxin system antitoxin component (TIGR02293 family)
MIRATIELIPHGDELHKKVLGVCEIINISKGISKKYGNYEARLSIDDGNLTYDLRTKVLKFDRVKKNAWQLLYEVLDNLKKDFLKSEEINERIDKVLKTACKVFEDESLAKSWLSRPQIGLGGRIPLEVIKTEEGAKEVEDLLGRIEHGVIF